VSEKPGLSFYAKMELLGGTTWDSMFNQSLPRHCGLRLALVCFSQGRVGTPHFQVRLSKRNPSWVHPKSSKPRFPKMRRCRKNQGPFVMVELKYLEDPLGSPCSNKAFRENGDLDLHLSFSDGDVGTPQFARSSFERSPSLGPPKELQV